MAFLPNRFYHDQPSAVSADMMSFGGSGIIKSIVFCNTTASAATITLGISTTPVSDAASKRLFSAVTVPANTTMTVDCSIVVDSSYRLYGLQGTAGAITVSVHGVALPT